MITDEELEELIKENNLIIGIKDARIYFGGCIPGWKSFCELHGYEWNKIIRTGLTAQELLSTKDAQAINLVRFIYEQRQTK